LLLAMFIKLVLPQNWIKLNNKEYLSGGSMSERNELLDALQRIEQESNIKKEDIIAVIESSLVSAYKKHVGKNVNVEAKVDTETSRLSANVIKTVVAIVNNSMLEIDLAEAKKISPNAKEGDEIRIPLDTEDFSRIAAQTAKQVIVQKIREAERDKLFEEYTKKTGQLVSGVVWRFANRSIVVDLNKIEAILPISEQVPRERFTIGNHIRALVVRVDKTPRGPVVVLSRSHSDMVKRLFEVEVPEIYEKLVDVVNIVREPGLRSKVVVVSNNSKVDPVGACVGVKGARVKPIIDELHGERIDLVPFSTDPIKFIASALSPAKVLSVNIISPENKSAEVIVSDDMLSLAIGKNGHNVRLAAKLTGWHIDIKSEGQRRAESLQRIATSAQELTSIEGIGPKTAEILIKAGYANIEKLANSSVDELTAFQGIGAKTAEKIINSAKKQLK